MNFLDYDIPLEALEEICTQGSNDAATEKWYIDLQISDKIGLVEAKQMVKENGIELEDKSVGSYKLTAFWIEAWNQYERRE